MKWLFREKLKVNEDKTKTDLPHLSYKQKCRKWDTKIASGFGLFAFVTLVGFVIYNILHANNPGSSCKRDLQIYASKLCTVKAGCKVTCDQIDEKVQSVADYINDALQDQNCTSSIELKIQNTKFNQSKLINGWLMNVSSEAVKILEIYKCTLAEIAKSAFAGRPFKNLSKLRIVNADIHILKRDSFLNLDALNDFAFCEYNTAKTLTIEEGALEGMKESLKILEISRYYKISAEDIINLTGEKAPILPQLETLVLSFNSISELKGNSFINTVKLAQLYFEGSALSKIDEKAFRGQSFLKLLNLSMNLLETLPNGTFNGLKTKNGGINLYGNRWRCNCSLQWLQDYYKENDYIATTKPPTCFYEDDKEFDEVDFCPLSESSTLSSLSTTTRKSPIPPPPTTTTTQEPTTDTPPEYIKVKCQDQKFSPSDAKVDITHSVEVIVNNSNLKLQFHELEGNPLLVEMRTTEDLRDYHLLWFNADYKNETNCRSPVENGMVLDELQRNTTYSFSLLYADDTQVSPNCTFCIKTEPEWKFRTWVTNKYQIAIIVTLVFIGIFLICLTIFITFLCIRRHPKIISGNKNVIIVKPKKSSVEEIPQREYEGPAYWEPYLVSSSHGYLTPKNQIYAKVRYRPPLMRSISEWSVTSMSNHYNYDDPKQLPGMEMLRPIRQNSNRIMEANVYDYRPPLPPPNPGSKRPSAPAQVEELYSSV